MEDKRGHHHLPLWRTMEDKRGHHHLPIWRTMEDKRGHHHWPIWCSMEDNRGHHNLLIWRSMEDNRVHHNLPIWRSMEDNRGHHHLPIWRSMEDNRGHQSSTNSCQSPPTSANLWWFTWELILHQCSIEQAANTSFPTKPGTLLCTGRVRKWTLHKLIPLFARPRLVYRLELRKCHD